MKRSRFLNTTPIIIEEAPEEAEAEAEEDEQTLVDDEVTKEIEVTDSEDDGVGTGNDDGGGLKRKRTIRVVIRSRAFL